MLLVAAVLALGFLAMLSLPQWWTRKVLRDHSQPREDLGGTGAQLARHLLDQLGMPAVQVEPTDQGDHYDPIEKIVRLSPQSYSATSLTALVTATHEVGHAIQDHEGYKPLTVRVQLARRASKIQKIGAGLMIAIPLVAMLTRVPALGFLSFGLGLAMLGSASILHLMTLPVEWDASFRRALPLMRANDFIPRRDWGAARKILTACALTYLAASLASLLNLWRWIAILRR